MSYAEEANAMRLSEIQTMLATERPEEVAHRILVRDPIAVFLASSQYDEYRKRVAIHFPDAEIYIMGSANLGFSLDPNQLGRPFRAESDIDLVLISNGAFMHSWECMRKYHRDNFYAIDYSEKVRLRRMGENVYSGFVTPYYIPARTAPARIDFDRCMNQLSDELVGHRKVTALFFRNLTETLDYYGRGLRAIIQS